jgi:hypothetical protein
VNARSTVVPSCAQADLIPQLSGVLMMQPLARTATNAAYCATASGDATSEEYRVQLQTRDGEAITRLDKGCRAEAALERKCSLASNTLCTLVTSSIHTIAGQPVSAWHDVPLHNEDGTLNFICEIPKHTAAKMEVATVRGMPVGQKHLINSVYALIPAQKSRRFGV